MRSGHPVVAGLAVAAAGLAAGCGVPEDGTATIDGGRVPAALRSTTTSTTTSPTSPSPVEVRLYWVADGRLASEPVSFAAPPSPSTLVTLLERGVPPGGVNQGLRSALSGTDAIRSVELQDGSAVVEVRSALTELPERDQLLAVAQIVATLTSSPTTDAVEFRLDGRLLDVPTPDGSLVRRPLRGDDYASLLS